MWWSIKKGKTLYPLLSSKDNFKTFGFGPNSQSTHFCPKILTKGFLGLCLKPNCFHHHSFIKFLAFLPGHKNNRAKYSFHKVFFFLRKEQILLWIKWHNGVMGKIRRKKNTYIWLEKVGKETLRVNNCFRLLLWRFFDATLVNFLALKNQGCGSGLWILFLGLLWFLKCQDAYS